MKQYLIAAGLAGLLISSSGKALAPPDNYAIPPSLIGSAQECEPLDVVFLIDTTLSMRDYSLKRTEALVRSASEISDRYPTTRYAVAAINEFAYNFRGPSLSGFSILSPFSSNPGDAIKTTRTIFLYDGGDEPEPYYHGLEQVAAMPWRSGARRVVVLFADAYDHQEGHVRSALAKNPYTLITVTTLSLQSYWGRLSDTALSFDSSDDSLRDELEALVDPRCKDDSKRKICML